MGPQSKNSVNTIGLPELLAGPWKTLSDSELPEVKDIIYKATGGNITIPSWAIRNRALVDFNLHLESLHSDGKPVPRSRRAYLIRLANYLQTGEKWKLADAAKTIEKQKQFQDRSQWWSE
jgi:hypothetical protein